MAARLSALAGLILGLILLAPATLVAEPIRVGGTGGASQIIVLLAEAYRHKVPTAQIVVLPNIGSRGAKMGVISATVDVGFSADPLSPAEAGQGLAEMLRRTEVSESPAGPALKRDGILIAATDQEAADAIASVPGALGTTTLALIVGENRALRPLVLDGVTPSLKTIVGGTYPHTKTIHAITRRQEARPAVTGFVQFLQTPEARALVAATGFLPLPARPSP